MALALLARYPLPTGGGTANNFQRVGDEVQDQNQFSLRVNQQSPIAATICSAGSHAPRALPAGDAAAGRQWCHDRNTGAAGHDVVHLASHYQRTLSSRLFNELRVGDTRRRVGRTAAELAGAASATLGLPGIPSTARFPNTLPTFLIAGYQQLGSPANTATTFSTSVTELADSLTWWRDAQLQVRRRYPGAGSG